MNFGQNKRKRLFDFGFVDGGTSYRRFSQLVSNIEYELYKGSFCIFSFLNPQLADG